MKNGIDKLNSMIEIKMKSQKKIYLNLLMKY